MEKHVGLHWKENTNLQQAIVAANGNIRWVCEKCYDQRWKSVCELSSDIPDISDSPERLGKSDSTPASSLELEEYIIKLPQEKKRRVFEATFFDKVIRALQGEGIFTLQQLFHADALWGMDNDMEAMKKVLTSPSIGLSHRQANGILQDISDYKLRGNYSASDFGCESLIRDYIATALPTTLDEEERRASSVGGFDGPVDLTIHRLEVLLNLS